MTVPRRFTTAIAPLLGMVLAAAAYGFAIGAGKSLLYAERSAVKFPLLLCGTGTLCAIGYAVIAAFLGVRLPLAAVLCTAFALFRALAILLASLAPVTLFLALTMELPMAQSLGGYPEFVGANVAFVAAAGSTALVFQSRRLLAEQGVPPRRAIVLVAGWLLMTLGVGGQLAFWLRPFFGIASLTGEPPFLLGAEPTVTGARNFYEVVWQLLRGADLPEGLRWR